MVKRIAYIDLAKGFCILLVVLNHIMGAIPVNLFFSVFRIPLYFFLSGLFFKTYGGLKEFFKKKTNKLLIPFASLYLLTIVGVSIIDNLFTGKGIDMAVFYGFVFEYNYINSAIWFLFCLFEVNIIFYVLSLVCNFNQFWMCFCCVLSGWIGYHVKLPMYLDTCMVAMPFFFFGYFLKNHVNRLLYENKYDKYNIAFAILFFTMLIILFLPNLLMGNIPHCLYVWNYYELDFCRLYITGVFGILMILFISKAIGYLPYISYIGRYSIVILGIHQLIHHLVLNPIFEEFCLRISVDSSSVLVLIIKYVLCVILSSLLIPVCIKYLPYIFAQKNLLR